MVEKIIVRAIKSLSDNQVIINRDVWLKVCPAQGDCHAHDIPSAQGRCLAQWTLCMAQPECLSVTPKSSSACLLAICVFWLPPYEMRTRQGPSPSAERQGAGWYPRETCDGGQQEGVIYQACAQRGARVIMSALK